MFGNKDSDLTPVNVTGTIIITQEYKFNEPNNEDKKEKTVLIERFVFKDEFFRKIEEEKNKCIRSILWTSEIIVPNKKSDDFIKLRKSVLDSVNEFYRKVCSESDRII